MPGPEEKQPLDGLARSIAALYEKVAPAPAEGTTDSEDAEDAAAAEAAAEATATAHPEVELEPAAAVTAGADERVAPPEEDAGSDSDDPVAVADLPAAGPTGPDAGPDAGSEAEAEAFGDEASGDEASGDLPFLDLADDDGQGEGDPLADAVEAFLDGDGDAESVSALAGERERRRDYDAVAAAVERLVERRDDRAGAFDLGRTLAGPLVRSRMVQHLGAERDEERRHRAHGVFAALGEEMAVALRDGIEAADDRAARRAYFDAFLAMGEVARPVVEAMVEDRNGFVARNGVAILAEMGGEGADERIVEAVGSPDRRVRRAALQAIVKRGIEGAESFVLGRLTDDTDESVRVAAAVAAGELGIERALRHVVAELDGADDPNSVIALIGALGRIGDPGAVPAISKHAARPTFGRARSDVRIAAYRALARIGTPHASRLVEEAAQDKDPEVRAAVAGLVTHE